eukprot:Em0016g457a
MSLPKLQLRHFNGHLTKWTSFWESFEAAVDKNSDLSGVEKFNYLSSLLEGTAKEAVSGLSLTEANYAGAVSMLKKRFGSTQQIIPPELQLILSRKVSEEDWNLQTLMAAIEEEVIARERLGQSQPKAPVHKGHNVAIVTKCTVQSNVQKSLKWTNEQLLLHLSSIAHRRFTSVQPRLFCCKQHLLQYPTLIIQDQLRIVLDNGSQRSYLTQHARDVLCLQTKDKQRLAIAAFGSKRAEPQLCDLVCASVQTKEGQKIMVDLFVVPHICEPLCKQPLEECLEHYPHLAGLELADDFTKGPHVIDMLIGSDFYWHIVTGELIRGEKGPVAIKSTLGWILSGPVQSVSHECAVNLITTHVLKADDGVTNKMLDDTMRSFWELESMGIQVKGSDPSVDDQFMDSIKMVNGRYEDGIVELVKEDTACAGVVHYLPHHGVIHKDKDTTKVRVVYDASSKSDGPSLNDCLHVGPKFNQRINELLVRFRSYPIALVADIEKASIMISISPSDRDALRFLWVEKPFSNDVIPMILRFKRVVFGVSSSPYLLNATIRHHLQSYSSNPVAELLSQSMYVDDVVAGGDTEEEAFRIYVDSKELLRHRSFNLRKFLSNSSPLQRQINERESTLNAVCQQPCSSSQIGPSEESFSETTIPSSTVEGPGEHKVLGVRWEMTKDQLIFDLAHLVERARRLEPTKQNVVSVIGQIYDPLGYLAPVTIAFKVLMQQVKDRLGPPFDRRALVQMEETN